MQLSQKDSLIKLIEIADEMGIDTFDAVTFASLETIIALMVVGEPKLLDFMKRLSDEGMSQLKTSEEELEFYKSRLSKVKVE